MNAFFHVRFIIVGVLFLSIKLGLRGDDSKARDSLSPRFEITSCVAEISANSTTVIETPDSLRFITPYFTANATIVCTTSASDEYTVGFIQQVDFIDFQMEYSRAATSWVMPYCPINDASGAIPPWYHTIDGRRVVKGGAIGQVVEIAVNDNFENRVPWNEPLPPNGVVAVGDPDLRSVKRHQKFTLWLVARRSRDGHIVPLRKILWEIRLEIHVDPKKPLGTRSEVVPVEIPEPEIVDVQMVPKVEIPAQALSAPTANEAQEHWWTPKDRSYGERTRLRR